MQEMFGIKSAVEGIVKAVRSERNLRVQIVMAVLVLVSGWVFGISRTEWLIIVLHIGLVLSFECLNTFVEYLCDLVHPDFSHRVKYVKYVAAGAVLIVAVSAFVSGILIFYPYVWRMIEAM